MSIWEQNVFCHQEVAVTTTVQAVTAGAAVTAVAVLAAAATKMSNY